MLMWKFSLFMQRDLMSSWNIKLILQVSLCLEFMADAGNQKNYIFCNYLELFHQVFDGLVYLETQKLVHRDIKCMCHISAWKYWKFVYSSCLSSLQYFSPTDLQVC